MVGASSSETGATPTPPLNSVEALKLEVERLRAELAGEKIARGAAEQASQDAIERQLASLQSHADMQEVATGETIKLKRCVRYKVTSHKDSGQEILAPVFADMDVPLFMYKIDLPPSGGTALIINSVPYYHNQVYKLDLDTLRTVKDMVHKSWMHEMTIKGNDENIYRKPQGRTLYGGEGARRHH